MEQNIKISIIGTGKIVQEVLPLISRADMHYTITSIYAHKNINNARQLADKFGIPTIYTDYDDLLQTDNADFIYIANVNTAHYEYALKALESGRNVIIEKPLCTCYTHAVQLMEIAKKKHLYIFEAVSLLYNPIYHAIASSIEKIGRISMVTANYSQKSSRYAMYCKHEITPAFDPNLAGGALMDLNVYNLNFIAGLFGKPKEMIYYPNKGYNGIDLSGIAVLEYEGFSAVCCSAKDSDTLSGAIIQGDRGYISIKSPVSVLSHAELYIDGKLTTIFESPSNTHRLEFEFREFWEIYNSNQYNTMLEKSKISLSVMDIITKLKK